MKKASKKDERDIELITLIENREEFVLKLPWEEGEITPIHVAELAKKELKGKTTHKIGGGNSGCIKRLMTALEKEFSGRLFRIRLSGSDRFWSLTNPELLKKFKIQFEKKEETAILVPQEPKVVIPILETPEIESSTSEKVEIQKDKDKKKPVSAPSKEDMLKAYLLLELLKVGSYASAKIKEISLHMGWKIPIYRDVNRVLRYYDLKNTIDTSGKRVIRLTPEVKRGDEDVHLLISMLESEISPISEDITYFIETGEIKKTEETEEKETIPPTTEGDEPSLELEEKKEEQKEEKMKKALDMDKPSQLDFLKKFLYNSGKYVVFQSELFQKIRLLHLDKITKPCEDFRDDPDVRIEPSRFNKDLGVREVRYVLTDSYCKRMKHDDTTEEEQTLQPEEEETVEVVIQESDHQHQPESKAETKPMMIELYSLKELNTGLKFSYSKQFLLSFWKYEIQIETKEDALRLIKFYYSHLGEVEFEDGATTLAALDNIVLN